MSGKRLGEIGDGVFLEGRKWVFGWRCGAWECSRVGILS
jgi:hypothetical protein